MVWVGWLVGLEARQLLRLFAPVYRTGSVKKPAKNACFVKN
jgi:hypothetical protein